MWSTLKRYYFITLKNTLITTCPKSVEKCTNRIRCMLDALFSNTLGDIFWLRAPQKNHFRFVICTLADINYQKLSVWWTLLFRRNFPGNFDLPSKTAISMCYVKLNGLNLNVATVWSCIMLLSAFSRIGLDGREMNGVDMLGRTSRSSFITGGLSPAAGGRRKTWIFSIFSSACGRLLVGTLRGGWGFLSTGWTVGKKLNTGRIGLGSAGFTLTAGSTPWPGSARKMGMGSRLGFSATLGISDMTSFNFMFTKQNIFFTINLRNFNLLTLKL